MSTATDMLAKYLAAEAAILEGKEVTFQGRVLRMEDLDKIQKGRQEWEGRVALETARAAGAASFSGRSYSLANFGD